MWRERSSGHSGQAAGARSAPTHCDPGGVDKTLVEMAQRALGLFLRPEADEAELPELAFFGELQTAVGQRAEGGEQLPETLLLHLEQNRHNEGGAGRPQSQGDRTGWKPKGDIPRGGDRVCFTIRAGSSSGSKTN